MEEHSGPLVPRNTYTQAILKELNAVPYDPEYHNGMRNPYSHKTITCEFDYNEYVREYVYYRLCDEILGNRYNNLLARKTAQVEDEHRNIVIDLNRDFAKRSEAQATHIDVLRKHELELIHRTHALEEVCTNQEKELSRHIKISCRSRLWAFASVCLALLLAVTLFWYTPSKELSSYAQGKQSGYNEGYAQAQQESQQDNKSSSATRSSSTSSAKSSSSNSSGASDGGTKQKSWVNSTRTIYVSRSGHKIHLKSNCSGMKYYDEMSYKDACAAGYAHCLKCF